MRERLASLGGVALRLGGLALIAILWQVVASLSATPWFPPLSSVLDRSVQLIATGQLLPSLGSSFTNLAIGYAISAAVGLTLGTAMALSTKIDYALRTYVDALLFVPPVVFAPVFFAFFGLSSWTLVFVVVVFAVFVIIVNTQTAVAAGDAHLAEMARSFGARGGRLLWEVTLPGSLPLIFSGLRLGMGRAVKGMIVGEIFVTVVGLGGLERRFSSSFDSAGIWAIVVVVVAAAMVLTTAIQGIDRVLNRWAHEA